MKAGPLDGRDHAERQPDQDRQPERERQHDRIDSDLVETRDVARDQRRHDTEHYGRRRQADRAAAQAQQDALGQDLPYEPAAARAERCADRLRPLARHPAREQQPRHVDTGNQQHENERRGQRQECGPVFGDHLLTQRNHPGVDSTSLARVSNEACIIAALHDGADLGRRLLRSDTRAEPPKRREAHHENTGAARDSRWREARNREGGPDLRGGAWKVEPFGQDADHGVQLVVQLQDAPDDVRSRAESVGPGAMTQQHDLIGPAAGFLRGEEPAEVGRRAQQREQRGRDPRARQRDGAGRTPPHHGARRIGRQLLERLRLLLEQRQRGVRNVQRRWRPNLLPLTHAHDRLGVRIRQRPEQHPVDDAEHRRVGADAERQRRQHRQGEGALPGERARRVADVPKNSFHGCAALLPVAWQVISGLPSFRRES